MNQKRTIIGACDYSISTMQNLKRDLQDIGANNAELNWAVGGIVATLTSNLLQVCNEVFQQAAMSGEPNAKQDLTEIRRKFSEFIERMVENA